MRCTRVQMVLLFLFLWATPTWAALPPAGTVTQVIGAATLTRADVPQDLPVKFRDPVYLKE